MLHFKSSLIKIFLITVFVFLFFDIVFGNYIYKKFIRSSYIDQDTSFGKKEDIFDHGFVKSYKTKSAGWGEIRYEFCTDPNSFRSDCKNQFKKNKSFDIAFIGDSFTEAVGVNFEDSFVGIISSELKDYKIANLAASSYSPSIYYSKINYLLNKNYNFSEVVVFIDISDIQDDSVCYKLEKDIIKRRSNNYSCFQNDKDFGDKFKKKLRLSSQLVNLIQKELIKFNLISYKPPKKIVNHPRARWTYDYRKKDFNGLPLEEATKTTVNNMKLLSDLLKQNNILLSVAVYPWPGTLKNDKKENKQIQLWKNFCDLNCNNFYDLMEPFFALSEKQPFNRFYERVYIKGDIHFNEEGNRILAKNFLKLYKLK